MVFGQNKPNIEKMENKKSKIPEKIQYLTGKWWFYVIILLFFLLPAYTSTGFFYEQMSYILRNSLENVYTSLYPIFKIIPILIIIALYFFKDKMSRIFSIYAAISYFLFAILQSVAITDKYGMGIVLSNLFMFSMVGVLWAWEVIVHKNDFSPQKRPLWKYWVIPFAIFAFWLPINVQNLSIDFNPILIFTSAAGLTFCMMTPVYLSILTLYHPNVNIPVLRVSGFIGIIIAFFNMIPVLPAPHILWPLGVIHIPLLIISTYAFILSFKGES